MGGGGYALYMDQCWYACRFLPHFLTSSFIKVNPYFCRILVFWSLIFLGFRFVYPYFQNLLQSFWVLLSIANGLLLVSYGFKCVLLISNQWMTGVNLSLVHTCTGLNCWHEFISASWYTSLFCIHKFRSVNKVQRTEDTANTLSAQNYG